MLHGEGFAKMFIFLKKILARFKYFIDNLTNPAGGDTGA